MCTIVQDVPQVFELLIWLVMSFVCDNCTTIKVGIPQVL